MNIRQAITKKIVPDAYKVAPNQNSRFVREVVERAIHGVGPLPAAAKSADKQLKDAGGDVDEAISDVIAHHTRLSAAQGFVTNIGGLVAMPATIPVNITGLAVLQVRMVASIAHLRGYDLTDPRVRNAVLVCTLGEDAVKGLVRKRKLPGTPMVIATAPAHDPELDKLIAGETTSAIVGRVIGKRAASTIIRRVPLAGGVWGASADGYSTWQIGRYATAELRSRGA